MTQYTPVSGIYVILNTKNGKVYIGQAQDIRTRWSHHKRILASGKHRNTHLQHAWDKYGAKAFKFQKLEYCEVDQLDEREQHYLDIYIPKGMCYNIAKDASSPMRGRKVSDATKKKMSDAQKGKPVTDEMIARLRDMAKNRPPMSEETKRKMSASRMGHKVSDETRQKLRNASKGHTHNVGRVASDETRRKISESKKNLSPETIQKMSDAAKRRPPVSKETRLKMSETAKRRHAQKQGEKEQ